jgi:hypothetical protein
MANAFTSAAAAANFTGSTPSTPGETRDTKTGTADKMQAKVINQTDQDLASTGFQLGSSFIVSSYCFSGE